MTTPPMARRALPDRFSTLDDPRQSAKVAYPPPEIMLLILCGVMAGGDDWVGTERRGGAS